MQEVTLNFVTTDEGLNLTGSVNFPDRVNINGITSLSVRGLAEWRHVPANIIHVNERVIQNLRMPEQSKKFSKVGLNWIGIKAHTDLLLSHATRTGKNGTKKVQEQLTKFFKTIGASSVKYSILDTGAAQESGSEGGRRDDAGRDEAGNDGNDD